METLQYMMLYHTTIRNIGLFSSVTLALIIVKINILILLVYLHPQ